ncbi:uncharacterized protein LAESUDRAFT_44997 [Laetiporus sulphureus 93-53]|uniref:Uncharacterized protein n=1 Tax=Laetiporus sulphureus 93-53 TaxID=1314785 RepID=A0A165F8W1_9APHY|nr:uncharacterized protein LAESUDRAFT_44997 [Laetiporus sulphureus 93-53]KZT08609.1 hypothetical protein LAESUDRAFT_44997 [Laetiporus sulphureus 93-53]
MSSCGTSYGDTSSDVSTPNMLLTPVSSVDAHDVFATGAGSYQAEAKSAEHRLYAPSFHRNGHYDDLLAMNLIATPGLTPGNLWDQDVFCAEHKLIPQTETEIQGTGANTLPAETTFAFDGRSLSQAEREAIYDSLSSVLGPACGIQESVGTYKAFMMKQTELYYERLLSGDISPSMCLEPLENSLLYVDPSPSPGATSCFSGYETQPHEQNLVPLVPSTPQDLTYYSWLLYGGHSYPPSLLSAFSPVSNARSDTTMEISRSDLALDITEILSSPVLEPPLTSEHGNTLNHNSAPDRHFGQGVLYEMIPGYEALGFSVAPVYRPMVLHHMQSGRDEHVIQYAHLPMAAMTARDRVEASLTLQSAKAAQGLEKTVQDKNRSKPKGKNRVGGRQRKRSSVECIGGKK